MDLAGALVVLDPALKPALDAWLAASTALQRKLTVVKTQ
jgi:hypothetical protein